MAVTPTLQDLVGQLPGIIGGQIQNAPEQQASMDQIIAASMPEALRKYGNTAQSIAESNFGRGMGLSSYNAYQQALNTLMQQEGTAQIANQAKNSVDAAQKAAIGNAVNYATAEQNRAANTANQKRQIDANKSAANRAAIIGGLGNLGAGTAGILSRDLTRPADEPSRIGLAFDRMKEGLGFGPNKSNMAPNMSTDTTGGSASDYNLGGSESKPFQPSYDTGNLSLSGPDSYNFGDSTAGYNFGSSDFSMPDFSLESLFNGYSPEDFFNPALF